MQNDYKNLSLGELYVMQRKINSAIKLKERQEKRLAQRKNIKAVRDNLKIHQWVVCSFGHGGRKQETGQVISIGMETFKAILPDGSTPNIPYHRILEVKNGNT